MALRFDRWLVPLALWTWGGIFVYFYGSGRLQSFLHPSFRPLVLGTGFGLNVTGLLLAFFDRPSQGLEASAVSLPADPALCLDGCGRVHPAPTAGGLLKWLVLFFPLVGAAWISPDGFGASFVRNRGGFKSISVPPATATAPPAVTQATAVNDNKSQYLKTDAAGHVKAELVDFQYAAQSPDLRKDFDHKILDVVGQFLPTPGANHQHFTLTRLFLVCCAADAQPINVLVEAKTSVLVPSNLPEMTWIQVTGTVRFEHTDQVVATPVIMAEEIRSIPVPKEKYLY